LGVRVDERKALVGFGRVSSGFVGFGRIWSDLKNKTCKCYIIAQLMHSRMASEQYPHISVILRMRMIPPRIYGISQPTRRCHSSVTAVAPYVPRTLSVFLSLSTSLLFVLCACGSNKLLKNKTFIYSLYDFQITPENIIGDDVCINPT
jgi:hypothetical protein